MVKILFLAVLCLLSSCELDFLGTFYSTDLDERLDAANSFPYLDNHTYSDATPWRNELQVGTSGYSFIFFSDVHIDKDSNSRLEEMAGKIGSAKFIVIGGDITQSGERGEIERFITITESFGVPVYPVLGNHDIFFGNWSEWRELIGSSRYRVDGDDGQTSIIILDTANSVIGADQFNWLEQQLSSARAHTFIFTHANIFTASNPIHSTAGLADTRERARLVSMLNSARVKNCFTGHAHFRIVRRAGSCEYVSIEDYKSNHTFLRVTVSASGAVTYTFENL
jgi:3',5'-cyclic AMP phosphodiesterase CpdA